MAKWEYIADGRVETLPDELDNMMKADPAYKRVAEKKQAASNTSTTDNKEKKA